MKVAIIGAGLSGLSAAAKLRGRAEVELFEKNSFPGGLCSTVEKGGYFFDYTGHFLHFADRDMKRRVGSLFRDDYLLEKKRKSGIFFEKKFIPYPFQSHTAYLPLKEKRECLIGFLKAAFNAEDNGGDNFYRWMMSRFGDGIVKYFMRPYNNKLWACHPREMTTGWMKRFVPAPQTEDILAGALSGGKEKEGYNALFYYPRKGIGALPLKLAREAGEIAYNREVEKVYTREKTLMAGGKKYSYDFLINTSPLKSFALKVAECPEKLKKAARRLRHTSVLNINLGWKGSTGPAVPDGCHWLYFPEEKYDFYRVGFPSNISSYSTPEGRSSCYVEISFESENFPHKSKFGSIKDKTEDDLKKAGVIPPGARIEEEVILPIDCAYVVYDSQRDDAVRFILDYFSEKSVYSGGRYGAWEYSTMEDALKWGERLAEKCLKK